VSYPSYNLSFTHLKTPVEQEIQAGLLLGTIPRNETKWALGLLGWAVSGNHLPSFWSPCLSDPIPLQVRQEQEMGIPTSMEFSLRDVTLPQTEPEQTWDLGLVGETCLSVGFIYLCPLLIPILPMTTGNWDMAVIAAQSHAINFPLKLTYTKYIFYSLTHTANTLVPTNHLCALWKFFNYF
jgi:hypothetical protein